MTTDHPMGPESGTEAQIRVDSTTLRREVDGHGGMAAEASSSTLANRPSRAPHSDASVSLSAPIEIVRATSKFAVEPWRLAQDRQAHTTACCDRATCKACRLLRALRESQRACVRAMNYAMREHWRADSATLDAWLTEHGEMPRSKDWPASKLYLYPALRRVAPELQSSIAAVLSRRAATLWAQTRWDVLIKQTRSPMHFRETMAFPLRADAVRLRKHAEGYELSFSLRPGRHEGGAEFRLPIVPRDARQRRELDALTAGEWRLGDVSIQQDRRRPSRWDLRIAYTRQVQTRVGTRIGAVNRGIRCFIAAVTDAGEQWIYQGSDIVAYLKQVQHRRREYQRCVNASGRVGHGRRRTLVPIAALERKGELWRQTKCQTVARRLADWFAARVDVVMIEDLSAIRDGAPEDLQTGQRVYDLVQEWPYYQLQSRLVSCLEERGVRTEIVPAHYISQRCPACGLVRAEHCDRRTWTLTCSACGYRRHLDVAAATNVLARGRERFDDKAPKNGENGANGSPTTRTARDPRRKGAQHHARKRRADN